MLICNQEKMTEQFYKLDPAYLGMQARIYTPKDLHSLTWTEIGLEDVLVLVNVGVHMCYRHQRHQQVFGNVYLNQKGELVFLRQALLHRLTPCKL